MTSFKPAPMLKWEVQTFFGHTVDRETLYTPEPENHWFSKPSLKFFRVKRLPLKLKSRVIFRPEPKIFSRINNYQIQNSLPIKMLDPLIAQQNIYFSIHLFLWHLLIYKLGIIKKKNKNNKLRWKKAYFYRRKRRSLQTLRMKAIPKCLSDKEIARLMIELRSFPHKVVNETESVLQKSINNTHFV